MLGKMYYPDILNVNMSKTLTFFVIIDLGCTNIEIFFEEKVFVALNYTIRT
jgi:hypothetical protein